MSSENIEALLPDVPKVKREVIWQREPYEILSAARGSSRVAYEDCVSD